MNRTAKTLAMILLTAFSYTMPMQACWWKSCEDWFNFEDDSGCDDYAWDLMLDDLEVGGEDHSSDSFWDMGVYIERDLGMDDGGAYSYDSGSQQSSDSSPSGDTGGITDQVLTGNVKNSENLRSGEPMGKYWLDETRRCSVEGLKYRLNYYHNSNIIPNLPNKFLNQGQNADCTARAIATSAWLASGDVADYDYVMQMAYVISEKYNVEISINGILSTNYMQMYSDYFDITEINSKNINESTIKNYIDSGQTVIGSFCTGDIEYVWNPPIKGAHDVTIIGYADDSYICAYGREDVLFVPKAAIESHTIHVLTGIKDTFVKTNK